MSWQRPLAQAHLTLAEGFFSAQQFKVWRGDKVEPSEAHFTPATAAVWGWEGLKRTWLTSTHYVKASKLCPMGYSQSIWSATKGFSVHSRNIAAIPSSPTIFLRCLRNCFRLRKPESSMLYWDSLAPIIFCSLMLLLSWTTVSSNFPSTEVAVPTLTSSHGNIILQNKGQNNPMIRNLNQKNWMEIRCS